MDETNATIGKSGNPQRADKLYIESNLLRIAGALFCHDPKVAGKRTAEIELNRGVPEKHILIRPDPKLGQPGPLAHKIFVALIKKHSDYGKPIRNEIHFTRREIGRLIGRKEWGGRDNERLSRALHEIHYTFVKTHFKKEGSRYVEHSFSIFPEILIERREFASDPIEACTVTLAEPIVSSLQDEHFTCLNHLMMQGLGTIGQALYMRAFFHFANLYTGRNRSGLSFQKRYQDVCAEWLGGLAVHGQRSVIEQNQLGPHLKTLVQLRFLSSYEIAKARDGNGFVLTFRPGQSFFDDYDRFYRRRAQGELQWELRTDEREIGEPLKVAYLFAEKRTGQPAGSITFASSKDVETAKALLATIGFDEIPAFLDYALAEARKTNFDIQTLGGVRQYLSGYMGFRDRQKVHKARQAAQEMQQRREAEHSAYEDYRRSEVAQVFASLPQIEREAIEAQATAYAAKFTGGLRDTMLAFGRTRFTIERHPDKLTTFEQWKADYTA